MTLILGHLLVFALCYASGTLALSPTLLGCQLQKARNESPLLGCPPGTIFVSPTDLRANFKQVQDAILSLPEKGQAVILIGEGEYHETVNVTRSGPLILLASLIFFPLSRRGLFSEKGQLNSSALSPSSNASTCNLVQIWNNAFVQTGMDDAQSAVLLIAPSFNASLIGAGPTGAPLQPLFGNTDFKAYNIDFQNRAVCNPSFFLVAYS
ncbi:hypothetical protein M0805_009056 [Coniferiporia weirii]|nr:hypothetical protein M0805_009056 [Coniferiporia weirii]